jgi:hypothetical protein
MNGTLPKDAETGATGDKDLSPRHDDRLRENDRLCHEWACHEGTLNDNNAPREEGPRLHEEGPLDEKCSALESETVACNDLAMSSSETAACDDLTMPSRETAACDDLAVSSSEGA